MQVVMLMFAFVTYLLLDKISYHTYRVMTPCYGNVINYGVSVNLGIKHQVELNVTCPVHDLRRKMKKVNIKKIEKKRN